MIRGLATASAMLLGVAAPRGEAADLATVDGFDVRLDTTVRGTLGFRTEPANPALLTNVNSDDGDRAFGPGLNSTRLDVYSELTATRGDFGFDVSAQGWYDPEYLGKSANTSPQTFNPVGVPNNAFPPATQHLMGEYAELVDAYVKDRFDVAGVPVSLRLGRQTLLWGESLFFAGNGIAAGQAPVDGIKALTAPLAEARELYLPVTQAVVRAELRPGLAVEAYDQFEWRRDRLPGVASYFSTTDILDAGGDQVLLPGGYSLYRTKDEVPRGIGQFGVALRMQGDAADVGLYALRYDAKLPEPVFEEAAGTYHLAFPRNIEVFGASASTYLGDSNVAGEASLRRNMPLAASSAGLTSSGYGLSGPIYGAYAALFAPALAEQRLAPDTATGAAGGYATGETWHAQASIVSQLPPSRWWQGASLEAELALDDLIEVTGGHAFVLPGRTHFAASFEAVFTPSYFQVRPGLDLSVPVGVGYTPVGRSSINAAENAGAGDVTVGVTAIYHAVWQASLSYTHFIGGPGAQPLADRDFALLSATRSF